MNHFIFAHVSHGIYAFGSEFKGHSGVFRQDTGVSFIGVVWTSATFGNGWVACESFNEARK